MDEITHVYILATISYDSYDVINIFRTRDTAVGHWYIERDMFVKDLEEQLSDPDWKEFKDDIYIDIAMYKSLTPDDVSGADFSHDIPTIEKHELFD